MARRIGFFEQAHGGTLFLDEICDLPLAAQRVLLHILEEGRFGTGRSARIYNYRLSVLVF